MNHIEKKVVQHCHQVLKAADSYEIYRALSTALSTAGIPYEKQKEITDPAMEAVRKVYSKPNEEVIDWFTQLLKPEK